MRNGEALPYRTGGDEIIRFVEARGRGHSLDKVQALGFAGKAFAGTLLAVRELGLMELESDELTNTGKELALCRESDEQRRILRDRLSTYEPYSLPLEALFNKGSAESTRLDWFETWWAQNKYGASANNRSEASLAFASLLQTCGLGIFVRGRRGHPSRIEWDQSASAVVRSAILGRDAGPMTMVGAAAADSGGYREATSSPETLPQPPAHHSLQHGATEICGDTAGLSGDYQRLTLQFGGGKAAHITVPHMLKESEKQRMMAMFELMVQVEEPASAPRLATTDPS